MTDINEIKKIVQKQKDVCFNISEAIYGNCYEENRDLNKAEINGIIFNLGQLAGLVSRLQEVCGEPNDEASQINDN